MLQQCRSHLTWLKLTIRYIVALAVLSGSLATIWCFGLALQIGYPLPFLLHLSGAPIILVLGVGIYAYYHRVPLRPVSARRLLRYMSIFTCQYFMILVYPLFNHVFSRLSASQQTPAVLILPAIKTICKHWINYALPDNETTKAEAIILNVEVFHALFVAFCMQSATSKRTVVELIVVDVGQALLSSVDIRDTLRLLTRSRGIPLDCTTFPHLLQEVVTANPIDNVSSPARNGQIVPASSRRNARRTNVDPSVLGAALQYST
ncbi:hypothetical protein Poli38472_010709 [Pythium oligandrum]|uniref:Uncharacterized protein n=1 Tax=Pythium oligandrum TaxID=41045 RepID=A0A8K1CF14_PYTOL|nr:hypothetical protein Poli38472_010709 [Pythium oligandrum]|eukprot:TMW61646.1 hypothetical protein Poli38472_010709 [Pythium oligandrum]